MSPRHTGSWFAAAVAASFLAGIAVGVALPRVVEAFGGGLEPGRHDAYVHELTRRYGLGSDQVQLVRMVLENRDSELAGLDPRSRADQANILSINLRAQERIKYVLNDEQRARFLQDSELAEPPSGSPDPEHQDAPRADPDEGR